MDKVITLECQYAGPDTVLSGVNFKVEVSSDPIESASSTAWTEITKYISNLEPLEIGNLTSEIIKENFVEKKDTHFLVSESMKTCKISYSGSKITEEKSILKSIE